MRAVSACNRAPTMHWPYSLSLRRRWGLRHQANVTTPRRIKFVDGWQAIKLSIFRTKDKRGRVRCSWTRAPLAPLARRSFAFHAGLMTDPTVEFDLVGEAFTHSASFRIISQAKFISILIESVSAYWRIKHAGGWRCRVCRCCKSAGGKGCDDTRLEVFISVFF
jgi:hypothetical protein